MLWHFHKVLRGQGPINLELQRKGTDWQVSEEERSYTYPHGPAQSSKHYRRHPWTINQQLFLAWWFCKTATKKIIQSNLHVQYWAVDSYSAQCPRPCGCRAWSLALAQPQQLGGTSLLTGVTCSSVTSEQHNTGSTLGWDSLGATVSDHLAWTHSFWGDRWTQVTLSANTGHSRQWDTWTSE